MSECAIIAKGLSKSYLTQSDSGESKTINVFSNLSFEINRGEVIGIIGANGSGKSTLLKIIAGISKPNEGQVEVWGTIASLIDIGAGFHPELSGLENIYLMGQLQGISKKISAQFVKEIIAFSEIGDFIHLPVKNYSKGMYLRLAFSTMIHLPFDVYLMDEVLSVGDIDFQEKCKNYLRQLAIHKEKTLLVISHNYSELREICSRYLSFHQGELLSYDGLDSYFHFQSNLAKPVEKGAYQLWEHGLTSTYPFDKVKLDLIHEIQFDYHEEIPLKLTITSLGEPVQMGISVKDSFHQTVFQVYFKDEFAPSNQVFVDFLLPSNFFNQGEYQVDLLFYSQGKLHCILNGLARFELREIQLGHTLPLRTWGPTKPLIHLKSIQYAD